MERERVKNIVRRSKDPLFCLERFKAKSEPLLDWRMDREEAAATEKKVPTVLGPDGCVSRADDAEPTVPGRGTPARRIEDGSLCTFKFSLANTPPVLTLFGGDADSSWRFQCKAESPAVGNCWFHWRVFVGLVPGSDHQFQDPGGTIFQRRNLLTLHNLSNQNPLTCGTPQSNMADKGSEIHRAILVAKPVGGKRSNFVVMYEKLGQTCYAYGLIGHGHKECGLGVVLEAEIVGLLKLLELWENELDDVVLEAAAVEEFRKEARWLAIGKVLTTRTFSTEACFEKMKAIWNLLRPPGSREVGGNLFIFQMHCLGDWKKVVHQGPWSFRGWGLLIEDYDGLFDPEKVCFGGMYAWAQIHGFKQWKVSNSANDLATSAASFEEDRRAQ